MTDDGRDRVSGSDRDRPPSDLFSSAITGEFDVSAYLSETRAENRRPLRLFLYVALGFVAVGIAAGSVSNFLSAGALGWSGVLVFVGAFAAGGFAPLVLVLVVIRPYRRLVAIRVEAEGFRWVYATGVPRLQRWEDPNFAFAVRRDRDTSGAPGPGGPGEHLVTGPQVKDGIISPEARQTLIRAAVAHDLTVIEEEFDAPGKGKGARPVPSIGWAAARAAVPPGALPSADGIRRDPPPTPPELPVGFSIPEAISPVLRASGAGARNSLRAVTLTSAGVTFTPIRGAPVELRWNDPKFRLLLYGLLTPPNISLYAPDVRWGPILRGLSGGSREITGDCYAAIVATARAHGLEVVSARLPRPGRDRSVWLGQTLIRAPQVY